ncbi:soma ferritin-like isoform X2 [Branchiostoma floridae]|nr:soma ferritin-like isoform X2 [Branchiostoma floridae]XP_035700014.1 soma ferritin-like isoform X2 [Branchiostoma floridae]
MTSVRNPLVWLSVVCAVLVSVPAWAGGWDNNRDNNRDSRASGQSFDSVPRMTSQVRQNFHDDCEAGINKQINLQLYASLVYMSMASYFGRDDVSLHNFQKFFNHASDEEREHARKLQSYQAKRGGRVILQTVQKPERDEWGSGLDAMRAALALEKNINQALLDLHKVAGSRNDPQMQDFLESEFLGEQVDSIKELGDHVTNLKRTGAGLGEYMFDKFTLGKGEL